MIALSVSVDGVTLTLPWPARETITPDQAQNLGNELLNAATAARVAKSRAAHPSNYRPTWTTEIRP